MYVLDLLLMGKLEISDYILSEIWANLFVPITRLSLPMLEQWISFRRGLRNVFQSKAVSINIVGCVSLDSSGVARSSDSFLALVRTRSVISLVEYGF